MRNGLEFALTPILRNDIRISGNLWVTVKKSFFTMCKHCLMYKNTYIELFLKVDNLAFIFRLQHDNLKVKKAKCSSGVASYQEAQEQSLQLVIFVYIIFYILCKKFDYGWYAR